MKENNRNYIVPIILVTSLFFFWAFLHNMNPVLIPHLRKACQLNDTESALIDFSIYMGYFLIALPAGWVMHKYGYKRGILFGLFLLGLGALLFLPAASNRNYIFFLGALFIFASGATFLETVANPYMAKLGDEKTGARRLNFAQSFNGVGAFIAPILGGKFILSGIEHTPDELKQMAIEGRLDSYLQSEADTVKLPYLIFAVAVFLLFTLFLLSRLPEGTRVHEDKKASFSLRVLKIPQINRAVVAQFFYVGAQVGVGSFFVRFSKYTMNLPEKQAAYWWGSIAMVGFMVGRFTGTFLMKYIKPERLLALYALINIVLLATASFTPGRMAVYSVMAVPFFMSIMFPTIFALGIKNLGEETKIASSFLVMSIVGGAFIPLVMGRISDATGGNIQISYVVPLACFAIILFFAVRQKSGALAPEEMALAH